MSKRIFSKEEISALLKNPNVEKCSKKTILYSHEFKVSSLEKYRQGLTPFEIFRQAGFDIDMIGRQTPGDCLYRWRTKRIVRQRGGRPKKIVKSTDAEKLKYLEAEVAYLKEENRFLAKLRKKS